MKIRRSSLLTITLAIITLALGAGCNSSQSTNSNGAGSSNNANASNTRPAATSATPPATTTSASLGTPTNTFMAFYEASKKNDVEGVKRTLSKDSLEFLTEAAKQEKKSLEEALTESLKKADVPTTTPEVRNEKIDGDKATLEIKDDKSGRWETFNFARENNEWKIKLGAE